MLGLDLISSIFFKPPLKTKDFFVALSFCRFFENCCRIYGKISGGASYFYPKLLIYLLLTEINGSKADK